MDELFNNAFVTSPGSSPSRASILTGLYPWQIEEAGTHASSFPIDYECFPDLLEEAGYYIGYTGKGWGPGNWKISVVGVTRLVLNIIKDVFVLHIKGYPILITLKILKISFMTERESNLFYFWVSANEPHRPYEKDSWEKADKRLVDVEVPPFLPDKPTIRKDLLDYGTEIEWYDSQLSQIIDILKEEGEFENTLIIVMADNGIPLPFG